MPVSVKVAGDWKPVVNVWVKVFGVWRSVNKMSTRVSSVYQLVFGGDVAVTSSIGVSSTDSGELTHSGVRFQNNGGLDEIGPGSSTINPINAGEWWDNEPQPGIGSNWRVRCVVINSGSWNSQAAAVGDYVRMDISRDWFVRQTIMGSPGSSSCNADFEIAPHPSGAAVVSFTVSAIATN